EGWAILLRQKQKKLIMLPSETMIWQPEFTDKTLSRKPGAVHTRPFRYSPVQTKGILVSGCLKIDVFGDFKPDSNFPAFFQ
ncbi:hypothetical protein, partial [Escherichia coli]|uniref:hypothetical protein n=1 Tax=Escherichia coli TaxID=562 RepID=UPI001BE420F5